jgi:type II secretory pathway component PulF
LFTVLAIFVGRSVSRRENLQRCHAFALNIPIVGSIRFASGSARALESLSALLESGIPLTPALMTAADASGDAELTRRMLEARELVIGGASFTTALRQTRAVSGTVASLVAVGEHSGRLSLMLAHAARLESRRATATTRRLVQSLEPALLIGISGVVALLAVAMLQAVYSVRPIS